MSEEIDIRFLLNSPRWNGNPSVPRMPSRVLRRRPGRQVRPYRRHSPRLRSLSKTSPRTSVSRSGYSRSLKLSTKKEAKKVSGMAPRRSKGGGGKTVGRFKTGRSKTRKKALVELEAIQSRYKQSAESMRTKIRKLKEEMSGMVEGTDEYYRKMRELGPFRIGTATFPSKDRSSPTTRRTSVQRPKRSRDFPESCPQEPA